MIKKLDTLFCLICINPVITRTLYRLDSLLLKIKYEDIRFVWMLHFKGFDVRTDTLGFIANGNDFAGNVPQQDVEENLIYCTT